MNVCLVPRPTPSDKNVRCGKAGYEARSQVAVNVQITSFMRFKFRSRNKLTLTNT